MGTVLISYNFHLSWKSDFFPSNYLNMLKTILTCKNLQKWAMAAFNMQTMSQFML